MTYEPDNRYSSNRAERNEIDTPFGEQPASDRGQFWNVDRHVRGKWTGAGATVGLFAAIVAMLSGAGWERDSAAMGHAGSMIIYLATGVVAGGFAGLLAAMIRRQRTGED